MEILYLCLVALLITLEHYTFGRWWAGKDYELARWTMGVATILGLGYLCLVWGDKYDPKMWVLILGGFTIGGAIKVSLVLSERANRTAREVSELREKIRNAENQ
jgi:hypothetical protein